MNKVSKGLFTKLPHQTFQELSGHRLCGYGEVAHTFSLLSHPVL